MRVNFKDKFYVHLDIKKRHVRYISKIKNPSWVEKHAFYPFIHRKIIFNKYVCDKKSSRSIKKPKERDIYYSAHIDRFIYQYYAELINEQYNKYVKKIGINKVVTAYRNNKKGLCNIHFSKEALEFICKCNKAWVFIGDFTGFFDNLDAKYLKEKIQQVLGVDRLSADHYAVYKSITEFAFVEQEDIESVKDKKFKDMKNLGKFFETKEFQLFKKQYLKKSENGYGIPQGSSISAVYANVYMVDFDSKVNNYITSRGGLYRRYCDDIIIVLPMENADINNKKYEAIIQFLEDLRASIPRLELNQDKTEQYYYDNTKEKRLIDLRGQKDILNYLGFSFDGQYVRIREKSLFKYYCRAYKKVRAVKGYENTQNAIAARKGLYKLYTHLGDTRSRKTHGNFLTYCRRADKIFTDSRYLESKIQRQTRRHWKKIDDRLKQSAGVK